MNKLVQHQPIMVLPASSQNNEQADGNLQMIDLTQYEGAIVNTNREDNKSAESDDDVGQTSGVLENEENVVRSRGKRVSDTTSLQ